MTESDLSGIIYVKSTIAKKGEMWVQCPFFKNHTMPEAKLIWHIARCPNKTDALNTVAKCPFNSKHYVKKELHDQHLSQCPDRWDSTPISWTPPAVTLSDEWGEVTPTSQQVSLPPTSSSSNSPPHSSSSDPPTTLDTDLNKKRKQEEISEFSRDSKDSRETPQNGSRYFRSEEVEEKRAKFENHAIYDISIDPDDCVIVPKTGR
eukprot:TRINITY_DN3284_c0_g1_i2.p1 TRINITY_DN3284_c0_g1~~TRINITY_DN3284_c0_g1_i2.p1  ORF type:complete len:205 (-),score=43.36 TRINITY_DN3284_c0_g1_i2:109-723(-)